MKRILWILAAVTTVAQTAGCIHSYLDPQSAESRVEPSKLIRPVRPKSVRLAVEYKLVGNHIETPDKEQYEKIARTINDSGMMSVEPANSADDSPMIHFEIEDKQDGGGARLGAIITGLTLGLVGSSVENDYQCRAWIEDRGSVLSSQQYDSKIVSTIGVLISAPYGWTETPVASTVDDVLQQFALKFIHDSQNGGGNR